MKIRALLFLLLLCSFDARSYGQDLTLDEALKRSGDNKAQLDQALARLPGLEMELLIRGGRQYDLVNITTEHLVHTVSLSRQARNETSWGKEIDEELWRNWVLPYRIGDEDLDDWRTEFHDRFMPLVKSSKNSREAVETLHKWLWEDPGGARVRFEVTESRDQAPRQLLGQSKTGRCFEINLLFTSMLRSVGVPARHTGTAWWSQRDFYHYWVEYWDTELKQWRSIEGANRGLGYFMGVNQTLERAGGATFGEAYALPAYGYEPDPLGREAWNECVPADPHYQPQGKLKVDYSGGGFSSETTYTAYVWNMSAWRSVAFFKGKGVQEKTLAPGPYDYLVTGAEGNSRGWQMAKVEEGQDNSLTIRAGATLSELEVEFVPEKQLKEKSEKEKKDKKEKDKDEKKKKKE